MVEDLNARPSYFQEVIKIAVARVHYQSYGSVSYQKIADKKHRYLKASILLVSAQGGKSECYERLIGEAKY